MSTKLPHQVALGVYGKIKLSLDPNDPNPREYIYQRVRKGKGGIESPGRYDMQLRRKGERIDNPSLTQLQGRARMRAATAGVEGTRSGRTGRPAAPRRSAEPVRIQPVRARILHHAPARGLLSMARIRGHCTRWKPMGTSMAGCCSSGAMGRRPSVSPPRTPPPEPASGHPHAIASARPLRPGPRRVESARQRRARRMAHEGAPVSPHRLESVPEPPAQARHRARAGPAGGHRLSAAHRSTRLSGGVMARVKGPLMSAEASGNTTGAALQFRTAGGQTHVYRPPGPGARIRPRRPPSKRPCGSASRASATSGSCSRRARKPPGTRKPGHAASAATACSFRTG